MGYEYSLPNFRKIFLNPSKQWSVCDKYSKFVWWQNIKTFIGENKKEWKISNENYLEDAFAIQLNVNDGFDALFLAGLSSNGT